MKTYVEFRSDRFPPCENEFGKMNSGKFGQRLAEFLRLELQKRGMYTGEPFAEDWGWIVPIRNENFKTWVGCANYEEYSNGFLCFIEPRVPMVRRFFFRKIDTTAFIEAIRNAIEDSLKNNSGISDIKWWTHDEFNALRKSASRS